MYSYEIYLKFYNKIHNCSSSINYIITKKNYNKKKTSFTSPFIQKQKIEKCYLAMKDKYRRIEKKIGRLTKKYGDCKRYWKFFYG